MKVVIDISPLRSGHAYRGVGSYTRLLINALQHVDQDNEYVMTSQPQHLQADVIHFPYFDLFFMTLPLNPAMPMVVTVHDVIPLVFPQQYPPGLRGRLKYSIQKMKLHRAKVVVTDSDCSKRDIVRFLGVSEEKVQRVYLAANPEYSPAAEVTQQQVLRAYKIKRPYMLYVGDINYNKNLPLLLRAFQQAHLKYQLVLVSRAMKQPINEAKSLQELIVSLKLEAKVKVLTEIPLDPIDEMAALYSAAEWYIQPSLYEGFGLPVLEAMRCEVPVIASTGGSLPEVVGAAGLTFTPTDEKELVKTLHRAVNMSAAERGRMITLGTQQAQQFSWEKTALQMKALYEHVWQTTVNSTL